nr:MAG TPA: hypothetical protein [Caudoviricetes sp.]
MKIGTAKLRNYTIYIKNFKLKSAVQTIFTSSNGTTNKH